MVLTYTTAHRGDSVMDGYTAPAVNTAPAVPAVDGTAPPTTIPAQPAEAPKQ
ncbi:MAG TPA: hypothetical protein PKC28_15415 [Bdellovibrionales bacterium]|nr:hypothetical protein [Bdellovibrionales bacterium]